MQINESWYQNVVLGVNVVSQVLLDWQRVTQWIKKGYNGKIPVNKYLVNQFYLKTKLYCSITVLLSHSTNITPHLLVNSSGVPFSASQCCLSWSGILTSQVQTAAAVYLLPCRQLRLFSFSHKAKMNSTLTPGLVGSSLTRLSLYFYKNLHASRVLMFVIDNYLRCTCSTLMQQD